MVARKKKQYYAVARGRKPGIYRSWEGEDGAQSQVGGFPNALYKGFHTLGDAQNWLRLAGAGGLPSPTNRMRTPSTSPRVNPQHLTEPACDTARIYTDGACIRNPGPGGYGVVLLDGRRRREFCGGFRLTTNNRMELLACIVGLQHLKAKRPAIVYSDSRYVVNGITKGWALRWRANGWMRTKTARAENADLWALLLDLTDTERVEFKWVKGHAGNRENERCDRLAIAAAQRRDLPLDTGYEEG